MNQRSPWANWPAIVPIPLLVLAMVALWVADVRVVWPQLSLNWLLHYGSVILGVVFIVIPAARSFVATGQPSVLMLGCGMLMMYIGASAVPIAFARNSDTAFAIYNTSALLGALCHFAGVAITSRHTIRLRRSATGLTVAYAGGMALMGLVIWGAFTDWMPEFFIDGHGGTLLRGLVVCTAVALFFVTAGLLWQTNRRSASPFLFWYALGLVLLAAGLSGSLAIAVKDSPLQWVTRCTQILGTVYMCVAVLASAREGRAKGIPMAAVEEAWRENAFVAGLRQQTLLGWGLRYGMAVAAVAAAYGFWLTMKSWFGEALPPFITFYPAVMVVALLAGLRPGLLATALADGVATYWIIPPYGHFSIHTPVNRLALVMFGGMGLLMSVVAEFYRRNRQKAAAYDRESALRESREALRRQVELIDPVRAQVITEEMQRVLRERGGAGAAAAQPAGETLRRVPDLAGAAVAGVGLLVFIGWLLGWEPLKSVLPGMATMKANTALCFLLAGVALALRDRRAVRMACAGLVGAVAGLTLAEYVIGTDFGLDQLLFRDTVDAHTVYPGRMVEATALGFLLTCASLLLLKARGRAALGAQQGLAVGAVIIGMTAVLGYAYNVQQLYHFAGYAGMALHTGASFGILAAGLLIARGDGLGAVLMTPGPGAQLMRRLLPAAVLAPAVLGWLIERGLRHGLYGEGTDIAILALAMIVSLAAVVWWTAIVLTRADAARRDTERQLRNVAEVVDNAYEPLIVREPGGVIRAWNRGAEALYGWSAAEALGQRVQSLLRAEGPLVEEVDRQLQTTGRWEGELTHTARDGRRVAVESRQTASRIGDDRVFILQSNRDVTERKRAEWERETAVGFLRLVNEAKGTADLVHAAVHFFHERSGCEAVGIRVKEGDDYPYYEASGFPKEFVRMENSLCVRDAAGQPIRDSVGNPIHECMCGNVIHGRFDPSRPFFTARGSFWSNGTSELLATTSDADRQARTRNRCNGEGYESVALIALRAGEECLGLLQLNDNRMGMFSAETIALWERLADYLAVALAKTRAEEALAKERDRLEIRVKERTADLEQAVGTLREQMTERERAEAALRRNRELLNETQRITRVGGWECDVGTRRVTWTDEVYRIHGLTKDYDPSSPEQDVQFYSPEDQSRIGDAFQRAVEHGEPYDLELQLVTAQGNRTWVRTMGQVERRDGTIVRVFGNIVDITERMQARAALQEANATLERRVAERTAALRESEEHLRASLAEKEVLLKEIHHRVKNNMQVISSLVALQADALQDAAMREVLADVAHRVRSMALVHEKLYQSADLARVEFAEYAQSLLNYLWRAHGTAAATVRLALDLEPVSLSVNAAVPCGLILNELVSNALKHAFRDRADGEVTVSLRGGPQGQVCLRVRDNGTGLPAGLDWREADSLGLRLVQMLAGQLHATVQVSSVEGTEFMVKF